MEDGITFVPQPLDTVVEGCLTDARFGLERDGAHKNADYGARILQEIFTTLGLGGQSSEELRKTGR